MAHAPASDPDAPPCLARPISDVADLADFVARLTPAVRDAARLARVCEGRVANQPKLDESTAVKQAMTDADMRCQEVVLAGLLAHYPGVSLEAEEDTPSVARFRHACDAVVIIDPIDGTLHSYLEGSGPYAVIVGLAWRGEYEAGLVALPREGLIFGSHRGSVATMMRSRGRAVPAKLHPQGRRILVSHGIPDGVSAFLTGRGYEVVPSCGGAVSVAPLIPGVCGGVRYATGAGGVSIRGRVGALIARCAGARVVGDGGRDFPTDLETPSHALLVAADDDDLELLQEALEVAGLNVA